MPETDPDPVLNEIAALVDDLGSQHTLTGVEVALGEWLARRLHLPVEVDNDLTALVAAEQWFGAGREVPDFAVVTVGAGVGYGLAIRNHVIRTVDTGLGLGGHFPLDPNGPLCMEGHRGCSTAMLSIPSICAQISAALGRSLGRLIAAAANLTMVTTVVLGGEGVELFTAMRTNVMAELSADRDPEATPITIRVASADFTKWARGAAAVAIQAQAFAG